MTALATTSGASSSVAKTPLTPATPMEGMGVEGVKGLREVLEKIQGEDGKGTWAVGLEDWLVEEGSGTIREHMDRVARGWKMEGLFADQLGGA